MTQSKGTGPDGSGHVPRYEQRGKGFSIRKITAEAGGTQAARREALRSAIVVQAARRPSGRPVVTKAQTIVRTLTDKRNGVWREPEGKPPRGENLRCPCCGKNTMKISIGDRKAAPVVFCKCRASSNRLINAIRREDGVWLIPPPRREPPEKVVERMRRSPAYEGLSTRAKAMVEHLVAAVMVHSQRNDEVTLTAKEWMAVLKTRSAKQTYAAMGAVLSSGLVTKRSRALSSGYGRGQVCLWGLACLPSDIKSRRRKPSGKRPSRGESVGESVDERGIRGVQPLDLARGGCNSVVYDPSGQCASERSREKAKPERAARARSPGKGTNGGGASGRVVGRSPPSSRLCRYDCAKAGADSDEAGQAFRQEAGHRFRFEAGRDSDLMSATWRLLPRIHAMMFCPERLVKRAWIWISAKARVAVGNGGRSALSIAP